MNIELIKTFLAIVENGQLSLAADKLFITQSTISARLDRLEHQLGVQLIQRTQGKQEIFLTKQGELFVSLAHQWIDLQERTENFHFSQDKAMYIKLASVNTVNSCILPAVLNKIVNANHSFRLRVDTFHTEEIYERVNRRMNDIGITFGNLYRQNVISQMIYHGPIKVVTAQTFSFKGYQKLTELPRDREVYKSWNLDISNWHQTIWNDQILPLVSVNDGLMLLNFLSIPNTWTLMPELVYQFMVRHWHAKINVLPIPVNAPEFKIYWLTNQTGNMDKLFQSKIQWLQSQITQVFQN